MRSAYFVVPGLQPRGGIVKVLDYAVHAQHFGYEPVICCHTPFHPDLPLFRIERFARLIPDEGIRFVRGFRFEVKADELAFFSWPRHYEAIASRLAPGCSSGRIIHLVQSTRHANPLWLDGLAVRLLARPMARIMITREVYKACLPHLSRSSPTRVIPEGHDWGFFSKLRQGGLPRPIRVGYTTWKSEVGAAVEGALAGDARFAFRSIRQTVAWPELRDLYHWADVFLGTPRSQEGFYLVGLEAFAAGALFVTPDAEGNRAYCRWGENCLQVELESAVSYRGALERLAAMSEAEVVAMRDAGYAVLARHTLEEECRLFGEFLSELERLPARRGTT
ncbi:MAG TPA: glycosyltransferase [Acidimicrobiia bacterium]|nr:glycosyltransferase [Acidimicrobiia bacterium]